MLRRQRTHDQKIGSGEHLQNKHHVLCFLCVVYGMVSTHLRKTDLFLSLTKTKGFSTALFKLFKKNSKLSYRKFFFKKAIYELVRILNALRKITSNLFLNLLSNILIKIYIKSIHLLSTELGMSIVLKIIICCAKQDNSSTSIF